MRMRLARSIDLLALLGLALLPVVGCGDDDDTKEQGVAGSPDAAGESGSGVGGSATHGGSDGMAPSAGMGSGAAPADEPEPAFLLGTRVWDDTTTTSYFHVVGSLDEGTAVDVDQALEAPGAAKLYSVEGIGWFALGGGEAPTITRYALGEDGKLERQDAISLVGYGITGLWDTLYVVSPTKMYYPDRDGQRLIIINPTEMAIEGEVDLAETGREGFLSLYSYAHLTRGDQLLFSVAWIDWNETDSILGETGLVVLDTSTDTLARFDTDPRCGGITQPVVTPSGDAYFASSGLAASAHRLGRLPTAPCALRVLAHDDAFDVEYDVKLGELGEGAMVGEPVPGANDEIFLKVFDETSGMVKDEALTYELTGQAVWHWLRWNVVSNELSRVDELEPSTADVLWFQVDGRVYGTETKPDYSETTLIELTAEQGPVRRLTAPGFLHGVARIR